MKDETAAKRNSEYRQRMREQGYVLLQVWCKPEDRDRIRQFAGQLREAKKVDTGC